MRAGIGAAFAPPRRAFAAGFDLQAWFLACIARESENRRLFPWLAVAFGIGILLFFAAEGRPSWWAPALGAALFAVLATRCAARPLALAAMLAATAIFLGFGAALLRTILVEAPVLTRMTMAQVEGFVESAEERPNGMRIVLRVTRLAGVDTPPERVRVTLRQRSGLTPGDYLRAQARLLPPPEAARPGGYDFARDAFYKGIGAVGSISGKAVLVDPPPQPPGGWLRLAAAVDRARNALTARIASTIGGQPGAVAAALVTGKRGLIDEATNDVLRAAGIYHVVSISGLHMVLAAGTFFWLARALLAAFPALALTWPVKKIAALVGMAGATAYCVFSGSEVATERSLLMILVMQGAILFDRPALSLRNLAISALVVLAREPETLLGPSLQMSYAAVAGMIALAELHRRRSPIEEQPGPLRRVALWISAAVIGVVATTFVASLATAPFGTYHFQNLNPYGIVGNAATLPLISLAIMPAAVLGVLAYPFGLDPPVWWLMGLATDGVLSLSRWVGGFSGAVVIVPAFGTAALAGFSTAILLVTLCISPLRWLGLAPALIGLVLAARTERADIYVARDGTGAAIRGADGRLVILGRTPDFVAEQWLRADGDSRRAPAAKGGTCDRLGCVARLADGRAVAVVLDRRAFAQDCSRAAIVVSRYAAPPGCATALAFDRPFLDRHGAAALRFSEGGLAVETVRGRPDVAAAKPPGPPLPTGGDVPAEADPDTLTLDPGEPGLP